ncbi:uncharacterized protein TNCT_356981 [Trichonephila clavata]|uniref:Uncharacterized protein n=1 Tax=Trichonephila clavata TaxID=2740835 RepID=A0A8X6HHQ6_TRICU|nr:uncharacterized protein TNCT_356981 [Trichonephila clavata]
MVANRVAGVRPTTGRVRRVPPSHWSKARCYRVYALVDASEGWTFYDNFLPWNLTFCPGGGQPEQVSTSSTSKVASSRRFVQSQSTSGSSRSAFLSTACLVR